MFALQFVRQRLNEVDAKAAALEADVRAAHSAVSLWSWVGVAAAVAGPLLLWALSRGSSNSRRP